MKTVRNCAILVSQICLVVATFNLPAQCQVIAPAPSNFKLDGAIDEWNPQVYAVGGRKEYLSNRWWIGQTSQGLVLAGVSAFKVSEPARDRTELQTKGRIEVWLSLNDDIEMPPISWVGDTPFSKEKCASAFSDSPEQKQTCLDWLQLQPAYREKLRALFTRMWRIAPDVTEEAHATPIYDSLPDVQRKALAPLKPSGNPISKFIYDRITRTVTFEVLVPWDAFPPADRLNLERVRFALKVADGEHIEMATPVDFYDTPQPVLRSMAFVKPIVAHLTPCDFPLAGQFGEPVFYFMGPNLTVRQAFTLQNDRPRSLLWFPPEPNAVSPHAEPIEYFVQTLTPGEFICSAPLTYRKGSIVKRSSFEIGTGSGFYALGKPAQSLPVLTLSNGTRLIKDGPAWSFRYQSYTQCGGCPWGKLSIFAITPAGEIKNALTLMERVGGLEASGYNFEMTQDWRTITEYRMDIQGHWKSKKYCLIGDAYQECGEADPSGPPLHGTLPPF